MQLVEGFANLALKVTGLKWCRGAERLSETVSIARGDKEVVSQPGVCHRAEDGRDKMPFNPLSLESRESKKSHGRRSKLKIYSPERSRRRFALLNADVVDDERKEFEGLKAAACW